MKEIKPIPGFSRYGITSDAQLFNLKTGKQLNTSPNRRGYHYTRLIDDNGLAKGVKRHRLVALTHLAPGRPDETHVNHKDLTPGNDWKDNLEWCTPARNTEHWVENGTARTKLSLEVMDVTDGSIACYSSASECARVLNLTRTSILDRARRGNEYIWPEGKRYRISNPAEQWAIQTVKVTGMSREVVLRDVITGFQIVLEKLSDALCFIGYKLSAVWQWASDSNQPVIPGLFQIQFVDEFKPWREVDDYIEELQLGSHLKVVITFDEDWKDPCYFESAIRCAKASGLKTTALNYRLKSKGNTVYNDRRRYCYYSDLSDVQKKTIRYEVLPVGRAAQLTDMFNGHRQLHHFGDE